MPTYAKRIYVFDWSNGKRGVVFALDAEDAKRMAVERQFTNGMKADLATMRRATVEEEAEIAGEIMAVRS